eukprot:6490595-Amphidinium_carterae.4
MFSIPKQQSHKRKPPSVYENNKQSEQQNPTTTFQNWADEVQIYMSLEDHNLSNIMEDLKTEKIAINDANYIDFQPHEQGLGQKNAEKRKDEELQRLPPLYTTRTVPIIRRSAERQARRAAGISELKQMNEYHSSLLMYQILSTSSPTWRTKH